MQQHYYLRRDQTFKWKMQKYKLLLLLITIGITICLSISYEQKNIPLNELLKNEFEHEGIAREYLLYTPADLKENAPLLVILHGFTSSSEKIMEYSGFNKLADDNNFAVVYPQGTTDKQSNTFWNVGYEFHADSKINDLDFIAKLVGFLQEKYSLSKINTFATGMSNGGEMCYLLACNHANILNAVAPVAGTMMSNRFDNCNPSNPLPIFSIFGTNDKTTNYNGDEQNLDGWGAYKSIPSIIDFWVNNMNYDTYEIDTLKNVVARDSSFVISKKYLKQNSKTEFIYYEIVGGGHDWPGAWGNEDINVSEEIWNFFSRHLKKD